MATEPRIGAPSVQSGVREAAQTRQTLKVFGLGAGGIGTRTPRPGTVCYAFKVFKPGARSFAFGADIVCDIDNRPDSNVNAIPELHPTRCEVGTPPACSCVAVAPQQRGN